MKKDYALAILTIREADIMPLESRQEIAEWLRKQAKDLVKPNNNYSRKVTARFLV